MTSFAQIEKEHGGVLFKIQCKSVNHRFFDIKIRAGREWQMKENDIKSWMKPLLNRGSLDLWVDSSLPKSINTDPSKDETKRRLSNFLSLLENASRDNNSAHPGLNEPSWLKPLVLSLNKDLWWNESPEESDPASSLNDCSELKDWFMELARKMQEARLIEGNQTRLAISHISKELRKHLDELSTETENLNRIWEKNLYERIEKLSEKLGQDLPPDSSRVQQEFVMLADKKDVSEELQRLDSHIKALESMIHTTQDGQVGKKLDFLAQELNREFTTLNNKIQDPELSKKLGGCKLLVEKIREQCLNLV
jgi:uncharacterized protein (TIGR00255 family)